MRDPPAPLGARVGAGRRCGPLPSGAPLEQRPWSGSLRSCGWLPWAPSIRLPLFPGGYFFSCGPICPPRSPKPRLRPSPRRSGRGGATHRTRGGSGALGGDQAAASRPGPPSPLLLTTARPPRPGFPPPPDAGLTRILRLISVPISMASGRAMSSARHVASLSQSPEPAHTARSPAAATATAAPGCALCVTRPYRPGAPVRAEWSAPAPAPTPARTWPAEPALRRPLPAAGRAAVLGLDFGLPLRAPAELFILPSPRPHLLILSSLESADELNVQQ